MWAETKAKYGWADNQEQPGEPGYYPFMEYLFFEAPDLDPTLK